MRYRGPGAVFLLAALCLFPYLNSFSVPFQYDDYRLIRFNFSLRDFTDWKNIFASEFFRPLLVGSFAINYRIGGNNPVSYHVVNLLAHFGAVVFFWMLLGRMNSASGTAAVHNAGRMPALHTGALLAAAVMAVHPLNTEAVTYISGRGIVLCAAFYLAALLCFDSYCRSGRKRFIFLFAISGISALLVKEEGAMIPFAALLYNYVIFGKEPVRQHWVFHAWSCAIVVLAAALRIFFHLQLTEPPYAISTWMITETYVWMRYLWLALYPVPLNVDPDVPALTLASPMLWLALALLSGLFTSLYRLRKAHPPVCFWGFWFFLNLLPSSVVPLVDFMAEHRSYLSTFGFSACLGFAVAALYRQPARRMIAPMIVLLLFYGFGSFQRNRLWQSETALWYDSVLKSPAKMRPRLNLAGAYLHQGLHDLAIQQFLQILTVNPGLAEGHSGLGIAYLRNGNLDAADRAFQQALELKPDLIDAKTGLAIIRYRQQRWDDSLTYLHQVWPHRRESAELARIMRDAKRQMR